MSIHITRTDGPYYPIDTDFEVDPSQYIQINKELFVAIINPIINDSKQLRELRNKRFVLDVNYRDHYIQIEWLIQTIKKRRGDTYLYKILQKKSNLKALQMVDDKLYKAVITAMWNATNV